MNQLSVRNLCSLCAAAALLAPGIPALADPTQPFALPVAAQLSNDVAALKAIPDRTARQSRQLSKFKSGLSIYHRDSHTLSGDIGILRSLNNLLAGSDGYPPLLDDAANLWLGHHEALHGSLAATLLVAPRGNVKTNAAGKLNTVSNLLVRAETAESTTDRIKELVTTSRKLITTSNTVARAAAQPKRLSSLGASIGRLYFVSTPDLTTGAFTNDTLDIVSTNAGAITRVIQLHVEGVSTNPATYYLATEGNTATYTAVDLARKNTATQTNVLVFRGLPGTETNRSTLTIDAVTTNYVLGHFTFTAEVSEQLLPTDTNRVVRLSGDFQLNQ